MYSTDDAAGIRIWMDCAGLCVSPKDNVELDRMNRVNNMFLVERFEDDGKLRAHSFMSLFEK